MQDIATRPLVDILSTMLGVAIVMSGDKFVELESKSFVSQVEVDLALKIQSDEISASLIQTRIKTVTDLVTNRIQEEVENYNKANGTVFTDIHSCASYKDAVNYSHSAFCLSVWNWNVDVWEYVRSLDINSTLTEDELIDSLPKRV